MTKLLLLKESLNGDSDAPIQHSSSEPVVNRPRLSRNARAYFGIQLYKYYAYTVCVGHRRHY